MRTPEEILAEQVSVFPATWLDPALAAVATAQQEAADEIQRLTRVVETDQFAFAGYRGEIEWLRAILKRCAEMTALEEGDRDEAVDALADIRGLINTTLGNPPPAFMTRSEA